MNQQKNSVDELVLQTAFEKPYVQYRAPKGHGEALISPPLTETGQQLARNLKASNQTNFFEGLKTDARKQLLNAAKEYTGQHRSLETIVGSWDEDAPIVMSGHQPTLFHAGVWFKNFALSKIANQQKAIPINLVIDNDVAVGSSIRVPIVESSTGKAHYQSIDFDHSGGGIPYEQTLLQDTERFESFAERVLQCISPLVENPCVDRLWIHAKEAMHDTRNTGEIFARARHSLEAECNLSTLEVPLSTVCESQSFYQFTLILLSDAEELHQCYNNAVHHYRLAHGIRSNSHPVPDLRSQDNWLEIPFWIYGDDSPQRRPAWVSLTNGQLRITDRISSERIIDLKDPRESAEALKSVLGPQFKLRPRALITTMYARLILSDLFLHGIGGGKYDQLGDQITRSFFKTEAPEYTVISATTMLPLQQDKTQRDTTHHLQRMIRDTIYQAETFAKDIDLPDTLIQEKQAMLQQIHRKGQRKSWHHKLERINEQLASYLTARRAELRSDLRTLQIESASNRILSNREHPFCLFNKNYLMQTFESML